jgi:hypothetical protein
MRYLIFVCIAVSCLIIACNNNKKKGTASDTNINADSTGAHLSEINDTKEEELQELIPYSVEQMKALLPVELAGGQLSEASADKAMGTAFSKGVYQPNDSTMIELSLFDCGGNAGAGFYKFQFLNILNIKPEGEDQEVKTIDFKGGKAIEHYDFNSYRSTFTYLNDRFLVTLESENVDADGLKEIANDLKLK